MRTILSLIILFTLSSCIKNYRYERIYPIHNESWSHTDTAKFQVSIIDTTQLYNVYVTLRRSINYPYSNLWISIGTLTPDSKTMNYSDLELLLESKDGQPLGVRVGNNIEHLIPIRENTRLKEGLYEFDIVQKMREDNLDGILNIGMRIEKVVQ